jgi:hypothetical protein
MLRLPDLPPLKGVLRWADSHNAGVAFELKLSEVELSRWAQSRSARRVPIEQCDMGEVDLM